ncbi:hypothetical protein C6P40_001661 [Pichia californica]|uniref:Transcription factor IIIA n=1 Tax=Pichia californica TaxID=460514 RepID=A0A9P6WQF9_9ASCO|nr:hypothetical protein C6P42_000059 [[Candida] californica]KAG0691377.1 hypothetical protein C6P40_001661 [[Candida] californica]
MVDTRQSKTILSQNDTPPDSTSDLDEKAMQQLKLQLSQGGDVSGDIIITTLNPATPPRSRSSSGVRGRSSSPATRSRSASSSRASSPRPKNYFCDFPGCSKAYSRPSLLDQHIRTHYGYRPFKCNFPDCGEAFTRKDHLERHNLKHLQSEDKPFHCSVCGKGVNSKQHLKRHEKTHFKSFKCKYEGCDESFYKHQSLKAHIRAVHEGKISHDCKICGKHFERPNRLISHMEKQHSDSSKMMCDYPGCYKTFRVWSALQLHIKTDHPRLECEICGKKCVGSNGLTNHMKVHDETTVIKLWKCDQCIEKFQKKEDAVRHYAEKHPLLPLPEELHYTVREERETNTTLGKHGRENDDEDDDDDEVEGEGDDDDNDNDNDNDDDDSRNLFEDTNDTHVVISDVLKEPTTPVRNTTVKDTSSENIIPVNELGFVVSSPTRNSFKRQQSQRIPSSPDVLDLLIDNIDLRLTCPYTNCHKLFRKEYDLHRHLEWHEKQDNNLDKNVHSILTQFKYNENGELVKILTNAEIPQANLSINPNQPRRPSHLSQSTTLSHMQHSEKPEVNESPEST